jgi:hypothetical protein
MIEGQDTRQEDKRQAFRAKPANLTDAELAKRLYLIGLVGRIDAELLAMATLFGDPNEPLRLTPPPDTRVTSLAHLFQQELKRRAIAATKVVHIEGEDHAHNTGTH